jgi:C-terminal processing protease CtpA/Prc
VAPPARLLQTKIKKSVDGIGLDLVKGSKGGALIQRLKQGMKNNPAALCVPPVAPGDLIVAVNGVKCAGDFAAAVKSIRALDVGAMVELTLERLP